MARFTPERRLHLMRQLAQMAREKAHETDNPAATLSLANDIDTAADLLERFIQRLKGVRVCRG